MRTDKILLLIGALIICTGITLLLVEINFTDLLMTISFIISLTSFLLGIYQFIRKD